MLLSGFTITFLKALGVGVWLTIPVLLALLLAIALAQLAGRLEAWTRFESFYWSFVTATTVGYGDLRPTRVASRLVTNAIAVLGLIFTGIIIASRYTRAPWHWPPTMRPRDFDNINTEILCWEG